MSKHNAKIGKRKQQIKQGVGISLNFYISAMNSKLL